MSQIDLISGINIKSEDLFEMIKKGETIELEFKDDRGSFSDSHVIDAVVAMTNSNGGTLVVGVTNRGDVAGCKRLHDGTWKNPEAVAGVLLANTIPACATAVTIVSNGSHQVLVVKIPKAPTTTGTKSGKFLKRILNSKGEPQNVPMTSDDILSGVSRVGVQDFSATVLMDSSLEDLDLELVGKVARQRAAQITDQHRRDLFLQAPRLVLSTLGLLSYHDARPNIAAMLLFGKPQVLKDRFPNHEIQYQVFGDAGQLLNNLPLAGPIATVFPRLIQLPELLKNSDEFRFRGSNVTIPEYPEDARRESIANAIVHRDFSLLSGVQIQLFDKELIITNPGSFPVGVTPSNLMSVPPTPRNRRLAEAMREFGYVESSGRGVDYIFEGQAKFGRPAPDYSGSDSHRVSVRLTGGKANLDFCRFVLSSGANHSIPELLILNSLFFRRDLTTDQLAKIIQKPATVTEEILSKLRRDRLVEMTSDRIPRFLLRGSANHSAMKAVKPARLSQAQIKNFKDDLISELKRNSPNSLSSLADLVGLSPSQARRLLKQLREDGKIEMLLSKKWTI